MVLPLVGTSGSASAQAQERARQVATEDSDFLRDLLYFFELKTPPNAVAAAGVTLPSSGSFIVPLILNPESIRIDEQFTVAEQHTAAGGLYVEESGIVGRQLLIRGTTGFKPRKWPFLVTPPQIVPTSAVTASYIARAKGVGAAQALSGQKHFQFLQDHIFRVYGDLKRSVQYAEDVELIFHMPKDGEHWRVIPRRFTLDRDRAARTLYRYEIEALIVGPADITAPKKANVSPDAGLLADLKTAAKTIRAGIDAAQAALTDINNLVTDISNTVAGVVQAVSNVAGVIASASAILDSIERGIQRPFSLTAATVRDVIAGAETLFGSVSDVAQTIIDLPANTVATVKQSMQQMVDALSALSLSTALYRASPDDVYASSTRPPSTLATIEEAAQAAAAARPPTSLWAAGAALTDALPGDAQRGVPSRRQGPGLLQAEEEVVRAGDTLAAIASRALGDPRRWREIAALNNLQEPYISPAGRPGTVAPGGKILVPITRAPRALEQTPGVFITDPQASGALQALGRDLRLLPSSAAPGTFDLGIDAAGGGVDFLLVEGEENLLQGITTRLAIEQGTDLQFPALGHPRIVGLGVAAIDLALLRLRFREAVLADPRVTAITRLDVVQGTSPDIVEVTIEATVRGLQNPVRLEPSSFTLTTGVGNG